MAPCSSKCSTFVHCNLGLVNWLCCSLVKQTKSGSVTHQNHKSWCPDQWMGIWSKWTRFRTLNVEQRQKKGLVAVPYKLASVSIYWDPELLLVPSWVFSLPVSSLSCLPTLQGFPGGSAGKEWAYRGPGTWSQGPLFRGDHQWLVLVTANLRSTSVTVGPVGPGVLVQKCSS